jgi:hypothetical protein
MTKLIAIAIIVAVLYGGWEFFLYWDRVKHEEETEKKAAVSSVIVPEQLPGLPQTLEPSLQAAQRQGPAAMRIWLRSYGASVQDPRKAWIELDYCVALSRDNPAEAKRVFNNVRERTGPASPVWGRVKELEKTYQ